MMVMMKKVNKPLSKAISLRSHSPSLFEGYLTTDALKRVYFDSEGTLISLVSC